MGSNAAQPVVLKRLEEIMAISSANERLTNTGGFGRGRVPL
jgi:hypothetical protein